MMEWLSLYGGVVFWAVLVLIVGAVILVWEVECGIHPLAMVATGLVMLVLIGAPFGIRYYTLNNTAEGARTVKDVQSNYNKGLNREIIVTAEDGRQIFYYKGKCDVETEPSYILFEDEEGFRHMIYKGVQDTVVVNELPENE